ncbi:MAG: helix-turn-helix domain-containing protein [Acholeplasmataceae bacterium]|nr:helix-turn-helix domain-containing protein [Acholeplasmataceae bacterium]
MYRFILIESKTPIEKNEAVLVSLFSEFIIELEYESSDHHLILYYDYELDIDLEAVIINLASDTLEDYRLYESYHYPTRTKRKDALTFIQVKLKEIPFLERVYFNDALFVQTFIPNLDRTFKKMFLRKYANDALMKETILTYLSQNQNVTAAAKALYVHRNTLTQRLEKFADETGFDVRSFMNGLYVYHLYQIK